MCLLYAHIYTIVVVVEYQRLPTTLTQSVVVFFTFSIFLSIIHTYIYPLNASCCLFLSFSLALSLSRWSFMCVFEFDNEYIWYNNKKQFASDDYTQTMTTTYYTRRLQWRKCTPLGFFLEYIFIEVHSFIL